MDTRSGMDRVGRGSGAAAPERRSGSGGRRIRLGLAALLGALAGATLWPRRAYGEDPPEDRPDRLRPPPPPGGRATP
ncbi:hypothetical protein LDDCCGHA_1015 [Methylobacterium oxalidis]|nr:hypothetical protein LDDCCGHA_1015 [Methylobacterium oxalidis]